MYYEIHTLLLPKFHKAQMSELVFKKAVHLD